MGRTVISRRDADAAKEALDTQKMHYQEELERHLRELKHDTALADVRVVQERQHAALDDLPREERSQSERERFEIERLRRVEEDSRLERERVRREDERQRLLDRRSEDIAPDTPVMPLAPEPDRFTSRLIKYIPAEVIALYLTLDALIRSSDGLPLGVYWAIFLFGVVGTYLYLWRVEKVTKQLQLLISFVAYCVWVFALGGPFVHLSWYQPIYVGLLLPMYTFLVPIIDA